MKARETLVAALLLVVAYGSIAHCTGCSPSAEAKGIAADEAYKIEHLRCVAQHETNAEIDDCRARVRERWGITTTTRKDAGQ